MIRKIIYIVFGIIAVVVVFYLTQPLKKGKGSNTAVSYQLVAHWPKLPVNFFLGNPTGIAIDTNQQLVLFHRGSRTWPLLGKMPATLIKEKTILVVDTKSGRLIRSWGNQLFIMPHGLTIDQQNNVWVTDVGLHQVFKFNEKGKLLMKIGEATIAGKDHFHFNQPTDVAIAKDGSFYVADGYGNSRIVKFSANGQYLFEWGIRGSGNGEFHIPHGIALDQQENVYVADRENNRIQVFSPNGQFIKKLEGETFGAICAVTFAQQKLVAVDDHSFLKVKHRGSDVLIFDELPNVSTRFGRSTNGKGKDSWYHDVTVDGEGNIYTCDILRNTVQKYRLFK